MSVAMPFTPSVLDALPQKVPLDGSIGIDFSEGFLVLRASHAVQMRIESLLDIQCETGLNASENAELDAYAEMDDYLSTLETKFL
jgi:hypothetical protein